MPGIQSAPRHARSRLQLKRSIGFWGFTGLVVNTIIGSGIFGIPTPLNMVLGRGSPLAMVLAGVGIGMMMACCAEVASRFEEAGGAYLYARTALGSFAGIQVGWFSWLAPMGTSAAAANLFTSYLANYFPMLGRGAGRVAVIVGLFAFLAIANCVGVRVGEGLSTVFSIAKLAPLLLLIALGLMFFVRHPQSYANASPTPTGWVPWVDAMLLLSFAYGGFENAILPAGEVQRPERTIPLGLFTGLIVCVVVYALVQFVTVATVGTAPYERPLAESALVLIGRGGAVFITLAAMVSTFGHLSAVALATPRLTYSLAERKDFPAVFAAVHPRFQTPYVSIVSFTMLTTILAVSGTFRWAIAMASGALILIYASICASLIRLRKTNPNGARLRIPFGRGIAAACIAVAAVLLARLEWNQAALLVFTFLVASVHWWVVMRRRVQTQR